MERERGNAREKNAFNNISILRNRYILNRWPNVCLPLNCSKAIVESFHNNKMRKKEGVWAREGLLLSRCLLPGTLCSQLCLYFYICLCMMYCSCILFLFFFCGRYALHFLVQSGITYGIMILAGVEHMHKWVSEFVCTLHYRSWDTTTAALVSALLAFFISYTYNQPIRVIKKSKKEVFISGGSE